MESVSQLPAGKHYIDAFRPYDAQGDHACLPQQALVAVMRICQTLGRSVLRHRSAVRRLVRRATIVSHFHFRHSFPLMEYVLEILGGEDMQDDTTSDEEDDEEEEAGAEDSDTTSYEEAMGEG